MNGVLLDSSVLIQCERLKLTYTQTVERLIATAGDVHFGISAFSLTEWLYGIYRAAEPTIRRVRTQFIDRMLEDTPVYPYLRETAFLAGRIGGEQAAAGQTIAPNDLMIGATALSLHYTLLTVNLRHFRQIPGLNVIPF